jgi:hypothetical protein
MSESVMEIFYYAKPVDWNGSLLMDYSEGQVDDIHYD